MATPTPTFDDADRALLARGYPHLRILVDDHPDDAPKKIAKATAKSVNVIDPLYHVRWPRGVAARYVHLFAHVKDRRKRHERAAEPRDPPTAEEAEAMIEKLIVDAATELAHVYVYDVADFVLLLEAFVGADAVVRGIVAGLVRSVAAQAPALEKHRASWDEEKKRYTGQRPYANSLGAYTIVPLGALFLRAAAATVKQARADLEALVAAHSTLLAAWPLTQLVMLLHGKKGVEEANYSWHPTDAFLFSNDPAYVRESVASLSGDVDIDAYAIWIGGEETLDAYAKNVRKVRRADADHVAEGIGMFASARAVPLMVELAAKKCAPAEAWLLTHIALARPELERIAAAGKKPGDAAAAILAAAAQPGAANAKAKKSKKAKKPTEADIERAFDRLMNEVVEAIEKVRGDVTKEAAAWADAATGYMEIRAGMMDEPATEYMGHFFMVDGVGHSADRETAWDRLAPTEEESDRWGKVLGEHG